MFIKINESMLGIEVPMDAIDFFYDKGDKILSYWSQELGDWVDIKIDEDNLHLLGYVSKDEVTFDCDGLVSIDEELSHFEKDGKDIMYKTYTGDKISTFRKNTALRSLIESKSGKTFVNPLGKEPINQKFNSIILNNHYTKEHSEWQTAENNTLKKVVILKNLEVAQNTY